MFFLFLSRFQTIFIFMLSLLFTAWAHPHVGSTMCLPSAGDLSEKFFWMGMGAVWSLLIAGIVFFFKKSNRNRNID